ncbi:glycosyltransferase [Streptococcus infantis]|uniref:glycosyltransferase n=1 Tax=Streptococcus infantis TaxID=68892 RepID=UPI001CC0F2DF|nr:nucleotide disphospho-sugar-binding domain-containing protein [Streptococcus infantis]MBZ2111292.1 glycosyl transferase [Streptococcus infantis]MBZ2113220.1 glycosyl transferase [Streptococcus infantis]MBZ2118978.1 glycosyl transferase [Streptococcus infantis]
MKKIKIDVVIVPLSGHLYPTMNLLLPLLDNPQYEIRLFTGPQKKAVAEAVGFQVLPILEGHVKEFEKAANNKEQLGIISAYRQLSASLDLINLVSDQLIQEWTNHRPDIVIVDFITLSGGLVAEQMGIPWITTMATQFAIETTDGPPCFFGGMGTPQNSWQVLAQFLGRKTTRVGKRIVSLLLRDRLRRYHFKLYNQKGQETIYSPYSILGIGMKEVELKKGFPEHYRWVGPFGASVEAVEDYPLDLSLFAGRKKVLVSCGTQLEWAKDNLIFQAKQLAKAHPDFHFFVTRGVGGEPFQCENLMENLSLVSYLPYKEYIPQMDYVIHHGGAGIFYQCIIYGKPALILPHDYDQFDYAVRGVEAGVAFTAKRDNSKEIGQAFEKLIAKEDWSELEILRQAAQSYHPTEILESEIHRLLADKEKE